VINKANPIPYIVRIEERKEALRRSFASGKKRRTMQRKVWT
jgi:hypothetical protein